MFPDFDRHTDPSNPISVRGAVDRGNAVVKARAFSIVMGVGLTGFVTLALAKPHLVVMIAGIVVMGSAPILGWLWWSFATPRWRYWAEARGANPNELQRVAEREKLVWPRGHFFERTEFPYRP